jgi:hypothetical protein
VYTADDRRRDHRAVLVPVGAVSGCQTTNAINLRTLDRHRDAALTSLIPALSCRSCRPNAPFAELRATVPDQHRRRKCGKSTGEE